MADVFDGFGGLGAADEPALATQLADGDDIERFVTGTESTQRYLVQHAATSETGGFLVFTALDRPGTPAAVDDVASVLSHELRNPLDVAKAHLQAARETGEPAHFDAVSDAHDRISQLIQDVLTLARGEEAITATESVSIQGVATEAWAAVETQGADLVTPTALPTVDADPDRVRRLFENLFRNAVEHGQTSEQPGTNDEQSATSQSQITVTVGSLEGGFYVADNGAGIPRDERDAVLTPGYTTATSGAGLGLAIVDRIVGAHGWELTLTASAEGGARFEIRVHS
ncbi:HAMP domain-containing histidine kinase [Halobacterium sp. KA-4]|uniref:sensor histidine kinase n=1 Tax=Halobacterium sp. KA-4 TaxID=2896367 RepID=UPI001E3B91BA|nr:HAMP domain-containing sensor histidine kinase [Halobacterium sp. KA-4]MCD2200429.1 HAMP domain-containing histidine kinase [Halobacterium sp. KA-4]